MLNYTLPIRLITWFCLLRTRAVADPKINLDGFSLKMFIFVLVTIGNHFIETLGGFQTIFQDNHH